MRLFSLLLCSLLLSGVAYAENFEVDGVGTRQTFNLRTGDTLLVNGTGHEITVEGEGGNLEVNGTGNKAIVTGSLGTIEINGTNNSLHLDAEAKGIDVNGVSNHIVMVQRGDRALPPVSKNGVGHEVSTVEP